MGCFGELLVESLGAGAAIPKPEGPLVASVEVLAVLEGGEGIVQVQDSGSVFPLAGAPLGVGDGEDLDVFRVFAKENGVGEVRED